MHSKDLAKVEVEKPMPRLTEADHTNNTKSLNRKLDRTLYLLVQNKEGRWRFPEDRGLWPRELAPGKIRQLITTLTIQNPQLTSRLQAAERILVQSCGINMNTWLVGNHPVGHYVFTYPPTSPLPQKAATPLA